MEKNLKKNICMCVYVYTYINIYTYVYIIDFAVHLKWI